MLVFEVDRTFTVTSKEGRMTPPDGLRLMMLSWTTGVHTVNIFDGGESPYWGSEPSATTYIRYTLETKQLEHKNLTIAKFSLLQSQ